MKAEKIYFNPEEVRVIALGLGSVISDLSKLKQGGLENVPWTPEAKKQQADMIKAANSAAAKIEKFTGIKCSLPDYQSGDEKEFLTKPS